nr:MAG TPA: hypothetical protein [Caudoviricetes sp.]DAP51795.1 MAG TPA: hypothetical protein [Caudoviricetes sp.]
MRSAKTTSNTGSILSRVLSYVLNVNRMSRYT